MTNTPVTDQFQEQQELNNTPMQYSPGIIKNPENAQSAVNGYRKNIITYTAVTYQVADSIDIDSFKTANPKGLIGTDPDELYYQIAKDQFITVYKYGVVCFLNYDARKAFEFIKMVSEHATNICGFLIEEEFTIETNSLDIRFGFNKIEIMDPEIEVLRLIMLNNAQSVALNHYLSQTKQLLERTTKHIALLGTKGNLGMSNGQLKKFIGKTLNLKNEILENLYIVESPSDALENEMLLKIDIGMKKTLRLEHKSGNVQDQLKIITEHLELFGNMMHHSAGVKMEWIIIVLVFIEVVNTLIGHISF
ncbi:MAG: RMD1 family protein [Bacteroidia bacterium]